MPVIDKYKRVKRKKKKRHACWTQLHLSVEGNLYIFLVNKQRINKLSVYKPEGILFYFFFLGNEGEKTRLSNNKFEVFNLYSVLL